MQAPIRRTTLIDQAAPGSGVLHDALLIQGFAAPATLFAAGCGAVAVHAFFITEQTLAALLTGGEIGVNRGAASPTV